MDTLSLSLGVVARDAQMQPVECLGQMFKCDQARRDYYLDLLAKKLKDPEFRKIPGFPKGTDEAILRMSDPPYYTACPNPFLGEFVERYKHSYDLAEEYRREPFAVDISEGKTDSLYRAHSYHTKVPHLAIVPFILHYTKPGDIVLDGFCGSGMTGVAGQWCETAPTRYRTELEAEWKRDGRKPPEWGTRRVVLGDLSPAATFIAANYNIPFDVEGFSKSAQKLLDAVEDEFGWMYETLHSTGESTGRINYTVWSEVFVCHECSNEIIFLREAFDPERQTIEKQIRCPTCGVTATKEQMSIQFESFLDGPRHVVGRRPRRIPVKINYNVGSSRYEKEPDANDLDILKRIAEMDAATRLPILDLPDCQMTRVGRMRTTQTTAVSHMFLPRPSQSLASLWSKAEAIQDARLRNMLIFFIEQAIRGVSTLNSYRPSGFSQTSQWISGIYYVPSQHSECSPWYILEGKKKRLERTFSQQFNSPERCLITTGDCSRISIPDSSVDYIFTDPPFGENIYYADLNFLVESWHQVLTNIGNEAIVDRVRKKQIAQYQDLICSCFQEYHRVLKPGHWMTVVFSNSKNAIWRSIQEAMGVAGFVVADVRTLDKQQGSFRQSTSSAVKQDLVISAYKPTNMLESRFTLGSTMIEDVWSFVSEHLSNVPVFVTSSGDEADIITERTAQLLHDRMIAFFVQRRVAVPISGPDFFTGLDQRYPMRDSMYFLPDQISEYDYRRTAVSELRQLDLFVQDEASATQWIRRQLHSKPQTFQDLQPQFMQQLQAWSKYERTIELKEILELNFLRYDGKGPVPSQIHSYLSKNFKLLRKRDKHDSLLKSQAIDRWYVPDPSKEGDLHRLRTRAMLREFDEYRASTQHRIRQFRTEAVRVGFKHCYDAQDYRTIVNVARKLPEQVIQEDDKLLMYYDVATMRLGDPEEE